jgi:hypothetical protein
MNSDKIFTSVTIQDLGSDLGLEGVATGVTPGTIAGHTLDAEACTVFEHSIARHYRGGKPKCFMPFGDSEDLASEQTWAGTYLAAVGASWNTFLAAIVAGAAAIEVLSIMSTCPITRAPVRTTSVVGPTSAGRHV